MEENREGPTPVEGTKTLSCKKKAESDDTIEQLIKFKLSYKYTDSTSKAIKIYEG